MFHFLTLSITIITASLACIHFIFFLRNFNLKRRLSHMLHYPSYQLRDAFLLTFLCTCIVAIVPYFILTDSHHQFETLAKKRTQKIEKGTPTPSQLRILQTTRQLFITSLERETWIGAAFILFYFTLLFFVCLTFSHQIYGPLLRFDRYLGNKMWLQEPFFLRRFDHFQCLPTKVNEYREKERANWQALERDLDTLDAPLREHIKTVIEFQNEDQA